MTDNRFNNAVKRKCGVIELPFLSTNTSPFGIVVKYYINVYPDIHSEVKFATDKIDGERGNGQMKMFTTAQVFHHYHLY